MAVLNLPAAHAAKGRNEASAEISSLIEGPLPSLISR
jgi:hypothetical protein